MFSDGRNDVVVGTADDVVHLFRRLVADVVEEELARDRIDGRGERIAHAQRVDFLAGAGRVRFEIAV